MSDEEGPPVHQRSFWWRAGERYEALLLARQDGTGEELVVFRSMASRQATVTTLAAFLERFRPAR